MIIPNNAEKRWRNIPVLVIGATFAFHKESATVHEYRFVFFFGHSILERRFIVQYVDIAYNFLLADHFLDEAIKGFIRFGAEVYNDFVSQYGTRVYVFANVEIGGVVDACAAELVSANMTAEAPGRAFAFRKVQPMNLVHLVFGFVGANFVRRRRRF